MVGNIIPKSVKCIHSVTKMMLTMLMTADADYEEDEEDPILQPKLCAPDCPRNRKLPESSQTAWSVLSTLGSPKHPKLAFQSKQVAQNTVSVSLYELKAPTPPHCLCVSQL